MSETLFHYTSNVGLVGILTKGEIWMSDPRFLNDSQEWQHAAAIVSHTIQVISENHRAAWLTKGCAEEAFNDMVKNMTRRFAHLPVRGHYAARDYKTTPYIFSLSEDGDSLSQWRAYGDGEYCIGFNGEKLAAATGAHLFPISYAKVEVDPDVVTVVDSFFTSHLQHTGGSYGSGIDMEVKMSGADDIELRLRDNYYFARKKDWDFREEREWRLVKSLVPIADEIFFRDRGRYPVPCAKVKIFESLKDMDGLITEVVCGPGADRQRAQYAFEMMSERWRAHIPLQFSRIPYRAT